MTIHACVARRAILCIVLAILTGIPAMVYAQDEEQYQISQRGTISQKLGHTLVSLDYSRPLIRNRSEIFGKVVHWGELWTPGANQATVLALSHPATLNGHDVPAGRWSMWIIPSQVGPWELVLDPRDSLFHTERPEPSDDQVRFTIETRNGASHAEALTWSFPRVAQDGATLLLSWGSLEVPLEIGVESVEPETRIAADEAALYTGDWRMEFEKHPDMPPLPPTTLTFRYGDDGRLHGAFPPLPMPPGAAEMPVDESTLTPQERERAEAKRALAAYGSGPMPYVLVPRALDVFEVGFMEDGVLLETMGIYHEFERENDRIVRLVVRNQDDEIMARGTRAR